MTAQVRLTLGAIARQLIGSGMRLENALRTVDSYGNDATRRGFSSSMAWSPSRLVLSIGKLVLSGGLVGYLLYHHGLNHQRLARIDPLLGSITAAIFALQIALATVRWRILLRHVAGIGPPYRRVFGIYYASAFFSQVLPSIGGDLTRVLYTRSFGAASGPIILSVLLDRGLALVALLFVALPSLMFLAPFDPGHTILRSIVIVAVGGLVVAYGSCLIARVMQYSRIWTDLPQWTRNLLTSCGWSLTSRTGLCCMIPLSALVHLLSIAAIFFAAHAVQVPLTLAIVLAIGPVIVLAQVLPISIGGWGVREAAAVTLLAMAGIDTASALLVSIVFGVLLFLATLPGVVFWLMLKD